MTWHKRDKLAELPDDSAETQASHDRADAALKAQRAQRPKVESLVNYLAERRERNGFGEDFQIAQTRRI